MPRATPRKLNVGVVGIGRMGQRHALNIMWKTPRADLVCACSPAQADLDWADEHLVPYGVNVTATFEDMMKTPNLEAVVIASATPLHAEQTLQCMKRGIHVLCEKPVAQTLDQLKEIIQLADTKPETKVMVGFTRRFDESYREARSKIQQGVIGDPVMVRSQGLEKLDLTPFFKNYLKNSGGFFIDSVIHDIDLSMSFFGEDIQPKAIWAAGVAAHHKELEAEGDGDNVVGICEFWGGKIAFFYNSRTSAHGYDNQTEIFGKYGKLSINLVSRQNKLEVADEKGVVIGTNPSWSDRYSDAFIHEMNEWVGALLDEKPMPVPLRSALTSLKVAMALQHSLKTGEKVAFDKAGEQITGGPNRLTSRL